MVGVVLKPFSSAPGATLAPNLTPNLFNILLVDPLAHSSVPPSHAARVKSAAISLCRTSVSQPISPLSHDQAAAAFPDALYENSPSRTLGGRTRTPGGLAGSPSRLGRTAAGLPVAESSALLTHASGAGGMWDGDAEDPALRYVLLWCITSLKM